MDLKIPSLQPTILRIEIIFPAISIFIVALRLFSRYLSKRIGWGKSLPGCFVSGLDMGGLVGPVADCC